MSDLLEEYRSRLRMAMTKLGELESELSAAQRAKVEPIAILGMGCRFPSGASTPEAFFDLLEAGVDAVGEAPVERFPFESIEVDASDPSARAARWGAFLKEDVGLFEASFFGISPREAEKLDPQQRLLLEVAWEALERAGQVPERLFGGRIGVFVGMTTNDYAALNTAAPDMGDLYTVTGNGHCFSAGRLSYTFGFQGPSVAVDTACSSSLVAVHLACQSLRQRESALALAGGVNLMLLHGPTRLLAKTQALSPDGRCRTFDAGANGFVRGEGCGVVVLKRLSDALRDGDPIVATLRGSAVNQDGRSTGLTAPNVLSQQAMLRQALENARVPADAIAYVETHGTGTSLGDPIEFEALRAVLGKPRADGSVCVLGAVKTNVGHLEAAAGMAGLIKAALCLQREAIPRNLHFSVLNPRLSLDGTSFVLPAETLPWKAGAKPRLAGVSAFGISGTNAHVILEEAPRKEAPAQAVSFKEPSCYALPMSAKSPEGLSALARAYREVLSASPAGDAARLHDIAYTASVRRSHHEHRLAVAARSREEVAAALEAFSRGESPAGLFRGKVPREGRPRVVFVFPGQGSQWAGMGRALLEEEPVFRESLEACEPLVRRHGGFSLFDALAAPEETSRLDETEVAQPSLFAIQVALSALWKAWGVAPDALIGHSVGEVAAAHVAGALSLEEAVRLVCLRGRVMQPSAGLGKMAVVALSPEEAARALRGEDDLLSIAALNDPGSVVLSGEPAALDRVVEGLQQKGVYCRSLRGGYAFHSPQMAPSQGELLRALGPMEPRRAAVAMYSTVTGSRIEGEALDASYWARNIREPVQLAAAAAAAIAAGHALFLEVGPHPVLSVNLQQCIAASGKEACHAVPTLRRSQDDRACLSQALAAVYAHGCEVAFERLYPGGGRVVPLPTHPFQGQRYWIEPSGAKPRGQAEASDATSSPLFGLLDAADGAAFAAQLGFAGAFSSEQLDAVNRVLSALRTKAQERRIEVPTREWLYALVWRARPLPTSTRRTAEGRWVVLVDEGGVGDRVADALEAAGGICSRLRLTALVGTGKSEIGAAGPTLGAALAAWWSERLAEKGPVRGVVHLWSLDEAPAEEEGLEVALRRSLDGALSWIQTVASTEQSPPPALWLVSRGAVSVGPDDALAALAQAPLWGLGRVVALEHPEVWGGLVDLGPDSTPDQQAAELCAELVQRDGENQIALRGGQRYVARLSRGAPAATAGAVTLDPEATYLIAGGLDTLGLEMARWMVERGARHLCLVGPREALEVAQTALRGLAAAGAQVAVAHADVAEEAALGRVLDGIAASGRPLRGLVHAAGIHDDGLLLSQSAERFARVMAPKVAGAWSLHRRTRALGLDFFVLFSSIASLLGSAAQGNHAAADAFLDALAHRRRAEGLPALSVNWGPWEEAAGAHAPGHLARLRQALPGMGAIQPAGGLRWLDRLLVEGATQAAVLPIDWSRWIASSSSDAIPPVLAELAEETRSQGARAPEEAGPPALLVRLEQAAPGARRAILAEHVQREVDRVLGMGPSQKAPPQQGFFDLGLDSLMGLELKNRLQRGVGRPLPAMLVFSYPTIEAITDYLAGELLSIDAPAASAMRPTEHAELLEEVEQLSEDEMAAMIDHELSSLLEG